MIHKFIKYTKIFSHIVIIKCFIDINYYSLLLFIIIIVLLIIFYFKKKKKKKVLPN